MENQPITKALIDLYSKLDLVAIKAAEKNKATCSKGCYACCHLMMVITAPEAMLIAEYLLSRLDWKWWARRLRASAKKTMPFKYDRIAFWRAEIYCPLLNMKTKLCEAYDVRPSNCRYYFVVNDPEDCRVLEDKEVLSIDLFKLEALIWKFSEDIMGGLFVAPLSLMVLIAMHKVGKPAQQQVIKPLLRRLPNPITWLEENAQNIIKQLESEEFPETEMSEKIQSACADVGLDTSFSEILGPRLEQEY